MSKILLLVHFLGVLFFSKIKPNKFLKLIEQIILVIYIYIYVYREIKRKILNIYRHQKTVRVKREKKNILKEKF